MQDIETGQAIVSFSGEHHLLTCAISSAGTVIVEGDASGRVHFLRLMGA